MHGMEKPARWLWATLLATVAGQSAADEGGDAAAGFWGSSKSVDEIALELVNPAGSLFSISNDVIHRPMQGSLPAADDQENLAYVLRVSWPVLLDSGKTLTVRAEFPFNLDQPTYFLKDGSFNNQEFIEWRLRQEADSIDRGGTFFDVHDHIYDINWDVAWGGVSETGFLATYGVAGVIPSSQDGSVERDAWMLGPEIALGKVTDRWIVGVRANHLSVARSSDQQIGYAAKVELAEISGSETFIHAAHGPIAWVAQEEGVHGLSLGQISDTVFPYPTRMEGVKRAADAYRRAQIDSLGGRVLRKVVGWLA